MKLALALSVAAVAAAMIAPASQAASGRCYSKEETIKGKSVIVNCGSATATITIKNKTYKFAKGQCVRTGKSITLALGTSLVRSTSNNDGFVDFTMTTLSSKLPAQIQANQGLLNINGSAKYTGTEKGTFSGTDGSYGGVSVGKTVPFKGTYNCGGTIYNF